MVDAKVPEPSAADGAARGARMSFQISAKIRGDGFDKSVVCCFDPTVVMGRLRTRFPDVELIPGDASLRDRNGFLEMLQKEPGSVSEKALRLAERDAQRRGPIWVFRLPVPGRSPLRGWAERYSVRLFSEEPVPEPLRSRFIEFLEGLRFATCVGVKSVRLEGNDEYPA